MNAFDTNILIYACDEYEPAKQRIAADLLRRPVGAVLLWQAACEFIAASRKLSVQGFKQDQAWQQLSDLMIAQPLVLPSAEVLKRGRALHVDQQRSFWDALLLAACLEAGVTRLYSEDISPNPPVEGLEIVNPFK